MAAAAPASTEKNKDKQNIRQSLDLLASEIKDLAAARKHPAATESINKMFESSTTKKEIILNNEQMDGLKERMASTVIM
jgi:hypothetical protein